MTTSLTTPTLPTSPPLVSVIIPTYNRAHLIGDSIRSVLGQTFTDLELIVVDDGSTDDTETIVMSFSDTRLRYICQPNRGRSNARNHALSLATGKYIAFLDSDDLYLPDKIQKQVNYLRSHPGTGMVYTSAHCIDEQGEMLVDKYEASASGLIYESIAFFLPVTIILPTVMTYKTVIDEIGGFDEKMHRFEDTDMWRRISKYCRIDGIQEYTCLLRTHNDNLLINQDPNMIIVALGYYSAKIFNEDTEINIEVRQRGLAELYRYYGDAFLSVSKFSVKGRELLKISKVYNSSRSRLFASDLTLRSFLQILYIRSSLGVLVYWIKWFTQFIYYHLRSSSYQIFSRVYQLIFKR